MTLNGNCALCHIYEKEIKSKLNHGSQLEDRYYKIENDLKANNNRQLSHSLANLNSKRKTSLSNFTRFIKIIIFKFNL
jgi:hypothetical protein